MSAEARAKRVRAVRARASVRRWEYRQRHHAKGTWTRLARVLADAATAWVISESDADALEREGFVPEPVGAELEPPKRIYFVPEERLAALADRREVPVRLGPELLGAPCVALVRFPLETQGRDAP